MEKEQNTVELTRAIFHLKDTTAMLILEKLKY